MSRTLYCPCRHVHKTLTTNVRKSQRDRVRTRRESRATVCSYQIRHREGGGAHGSRCLGHDIRASLGAD